MQPDTSWVHTEKRSLINDETQLIILANESNVIDYTSDFSLSQVVFDRRVLTIIITLGLQLNYQKITVTC